MRAIGEVELDDPAVASVRHVDACRRRIASQAGRVVELTRAFAAGADGAMELAVAVDELQAAATAVGDKLSAARD